MGQMVSAIGIDNLLRRGTLSREGKVPQMVPELIFGSAADGASLITELLVKIYNILLNVCFCNRLWLFYNFMPFMTH